MIKSIPYSLPSNSSPIPSASQLHVCSSYKTSYHRTHLVLVIRAQVWGHLLEHEQPFRGPEERAERMCKPEAMDECSEAESSEYKTIAQMNQQQLGPSAQAKSDENPA